MYELMFKGERPQDFRQLVFFRPFGPVVRVKNERVDTRHMLINIIVPLSRRADTFRQFINNFRFEQNETTWPTISGGFGSKDNNLRCIYRVFLSASTIVMSGVYDHQVLETFCFD